jgi:hypothetical protein
VFLISPRTLFLVAVSSLGHLDRRLFSCACRCSDSMRVLKYGACRYGQRGGSNVPRGIMNMAMLGMTIRLVACWTSQEERSWWWWKVLQTAVKSAVVRGSPLSLGSLINGAQVETWIPIRVDTAGNQLQILLLVTEKTYLRPSAGPPALV